ncbi:MAG: two-component sensor histidine kinase [Leptolyngbya sp. SIO1D8]|nr:two-component sensor histidine kinase [Leptolyngbya sp. SIO1D8]
MPNPRPRSFRRLLIFRLLLLGIPILLIGQYVTLRKARTGLLETARQNLTSSAVRKAEFLSQNGDLLASKIRLLSKIQTLQGDDLTAIEATLAEFTTGTPLSQACVHLTDAQATTVLVTTCNTPVSLSETLLPWARSTLINESDFALVDITSHPAELTADNMRDRYAQIEMTWAAPIYSADQELKYNLFLRTRLSQLENISARSLVGHTVLLDERGTVVVHPDASLEGQVIQNLGDADRLQSILRNAQLDRQATLHLFSFLPNYEEWLAGYTKLELEVAPGQIEQWVVLAVTPLEYALQGLADIRNVLIFLTLGLLTAQVVLVLYLAQRLSKPVERLCQYAYETQDLSHLKEVPQNFRVWEFNHLARVLNGMMKRLEQRAQELQHAWKDAQMANQLKSEFLANTSHELRTPLNAIIGCIRLVKDGCCDNDQESQEFLETADQAAIHLLGIINDILDIAKIESGTLEVDLAVVDVRQVVNEVADLQNLQVQQKGLILCCSESKNPLWVMADPAKLKQVLLNIVYNAIKFTDVGEIAIDTYLETEENYHASTYWPPGIQLPTSFPRVIVSIADTGVGIALSQQKKLFQPFVMADGSTTRQHEGTGLGLAICRNLVTLMGGSITLYSAGIGHGTQVLFALPLVDPHQLTSMDSTDSGIHQTLDIATEA